MVKIITNLIQILELKVDLNTNLVVFIEKTGFHYIIKAYFGFGFHSGERDNSPTACSRCPCLRIKTYFIVFGNHHQRLEKNSYEVKVKSNTSISTRVEVKVSTKNFTYVKVKSIGKNYLSESNTEMKLLGRL